MLPDETVLDDSFGVTSRRAVRVSVVSVIRIHVSPYEIATWHFAAAAHGLPTPIV